MGGADQHPESHTPPQRSARGLWPQRWRWRISLGLLLVLLATALAAWLGREQIAGNVINDLLEQNDLEAEYEIVSITPQEQIIENLIVGDPTQPDFKAERVVIEIEYGFGTPAIGGVQLVRPRIYGRYSDNVLSFGSLDPLILTESDEPAGLPEIDLTIVDGRGLVEGDYGAVAIKLDGSGPLDDGFAGKLAITAPRAGTKTCSVVSATAYGDLTTNAGVPEFAGPVRLRDLRCEGATLASADIGAELALTRDFTSVGGSFELSASKLVYANYSSEALSGRTDFSANSAELSFNHDLTASGLATSFGSFEELRADGSLRGTGDFDRADWDIRITGTGTALDGEAIAALSDAKEAGEGTLIAPLLEKFERSFERAAQGGGLSADVTLRNDQGAMTFVVPEARFRASNGETLIALSRLSWTNDIESGDRFRGNIVTGGEGLPRINGRMEQTGDGRFVLRLAMAEYRADDSRIAVPRLQISQNANGTIGFNGTVTASGPIPSGNVSGLELPVAATWGERTGLALGPRCTTVRFDTLKLSELTVDANRLVICPSDGRAIVRYNETLRVAARMGEISLSGRLAGSPAEFAVSNASIAYPGTFSLADLGAGIGEPDNVVRLAASTLEGTLDQSVGGRFADGSAMLDVVPLDLNEMSGGWSYENGALRIDDASFRLTERIDGNARFEPLIAKGATLTLADGDITAKADLFNPGSQRLITSVDIRHDLAASKGRASIAVPGLTLDEALTPVDLSFLAQGVIANADGTITGEGRIDWSEDTITSGGTFRTDDLDLAAAFGPIQGLTGEIVFTDLISLTTAPKQLIQIDAINPGIEVLSGLVTFSMTNGEIIEVEDARWPFMGGELILRPVTIDYGAQGGQRYVFEIIALDAATFIAQMELSNLGARGTFDGTVPIAFDELGNGTIENGLLISRPPGGNVSYIGELTYEDLGVISNYAFQSLRSLDYTQMSIGLNGNLAGEIITNFQFDGVRQGEGASQNFVTRRLAKLPIRFKVNVRSQNFYQLATMVRSFFDPTFLGNPIDRGLLSAEDGRFVPATPFAEPLPDTPSDQSDPRNAPELRRPDEPAVQPSESDDLP